MNSCIIIVFTKADVLYYVSALKRLSILRYSVISNIRAQLFKSNDVVS